MTGSRIEVFTTQEELMGRAAGIVVASATAGPVALSGGETPRPLYEALARADVAGDWYQVDERAVPYGHPDSNATMIERAGLPLHRVDTALEPDAAAAAYEQLLRDTWSESRPSLALLGIGKDGHTASLFPGSPELDEGRRWVVATRDAHEGHRRITMTLPLLGRFRQRVFLVSGTGKAAAVRRVLASGEPLPAGRVPGAVWLLDAGAASQLGETLRDRPAG